MPQCNPARQVQVGKFGIQRRLASLESSSAPKLHKSLQSPRALQTSRPGTAKTDRSGQPLSRDTWTLDFLIPLGPSGFPILVHPLEWWTVFPPSTLHKHLEPAPTGSSKSVGTTR